MFMLFILAVIFNKEMALLFQFYAAVGIHITFGSGGEGAGPLAFFLLGFS